MTAKPIDTSIFDPDFIESRIDRTDDCWNWTGALDSKGYGVIYVRNHRNSAGIYFAHRVVLALSGRNPPPHLVIDHLCRNHRCVNPTHLEPVSDAENTRRGASRAGSAIRAREEGRCVNGHDLAAVGVYFSQGVTICKQCAKDKARKQVERKRAMSIATDTRTVHAARAGGCEVVRYDRAGKWYLEWPTEHHIRRQRITIARAVDEALMADHEPHGHVYLGRYGGGRFDALFQAVRETTA